MMRTRGTRTVIYLRQSQDRAGEELGVTRQLAGCRDLCGRAGLHVVEVVTENAKSASSGKRRPGWEHVQALAKAGEIDVIVAYRIDRVYRRQDDLEGLVVLVESTGVQIRTVASGDYDLSTADGRMIARVVGAFAAGEVEKASERRKYANDQRAERGVPNGSPRAFGYEIDGVTIREDEAKVIRDVAERLLAGEGVIAIVRDLRAQGVRSSRGKPFSHTSFRRMILKPRLIGKREHRGVIVGDAQWPAILDEDVFRRLRSLLEDPARRTQNGRQRHLLSGLLVCFNCGGPLLSYQHRGGHRDANGDRAVTPKYACRKQAGGCGAVSVTAAPIEEAVVASVLAVADGPALADALAVGSEPKMPESVVEQLETELLELAKERARGDLTPEEHKTIRAGIMTRLDVARRADARAVRRLEAARRVAGLRERWPSMTDEVRRNVLRDVLVSVEVGPGFIGRPRPGSTPVDRLRRWRWVDEIEAGD